MRKIKYLAPILGLSAMVGTLIPITTACAKTVVSTVLPYNLLKSNGVTVTGIVAGTDLTKYDTIEIPEGYEYIDVDAFNHVKDTEVNAEEEEATFVYSTITKIVLPSTLRAVNADAFLGLTALKTIDCTGWNADTIQYMDFAPNCFNSAADKNSRYLKVNLPEGLTLNQTNHVKSIFDYAGIPAYCFVDQTTGHISATEGASKNNNAVTDNTTNYVDDNWVVHSGSISDQEISLTLAETFDTDKYALAVYTQQTSSTAKTDKIEVVDPTPTISDNKVVTFKTKMTNTADYWDEEKTSKAQSLYYYYPMLASEGNEVNYDINVVCTKKSTGEVVWTQKVDGYKTTNAVTHVEKIEFEDGSEASAWLSSIPSEYTNWALPKIKITPTNALLPGYSLKSDNEDIVWTYYDEDDAAYYAGVKQIGEANVTVVSQDEKAPATSAGTVHVNVVGVDCLEYNKTEGGADGFLGQVYGKWIEKFPGKNYGYTLPANAEVTYRIRLGQSPEGYYKVPEVYNSNYTSVSHQYRTFAVMRQVAGTESEPKYEPIRATGATMYIQHSDGTIVSVSQDEFGFYQETGYRAALKKDYTIAEATDESIHFKDDDTIYITFKFDNEEPIESTGFEFESFATA